MKKCALTIRRPNGQVETVVADNLQFALSDAALEQARQATRDAGKGEILSAKVVRVDAPMTLRDQRDALVDAYTAQVETLKASEHQDVTAGIGRDHSDIKAKVTAAKQALTDFDAANPELVAEIAVTEADQKAERIQSALNA